MTELENNLNTTEEVVETMEEGVQPDSKSEKGDAKPVKQGSSDAETIGQGNVEVVKPEENPVDKAVAAQKKAESVPAVKGDAQQKNAGKGDAQPKLKKVSEDESESKKDEVKSSKMESIKAIVNNMKEMTKEEISTVLGTVSEEEVDESLTKAEVARKVVESLKSMSEEDVAEAYAKMKGKEDKEEEVKSESVEEELTADLESSLVEIEIDDDLSAISEALDLSDENAEKAKTIFKAAVTSKVAEVKESLDAQYQEELKSTVATVKGDLAEAVDKYLSYTAEEWVKENELAIERGLRSEMTENFIEGLKTLFVEHYVDVPEDKYSVIDELANRLDEMEVKLDSEVSRNMDIAEELETLKRENVISEASKDLTDSQKEKLSSLAEGVEYKTEEDFAEKISEVKNAYFPTEGGKIVEETLIQEGTGEFEVEKSAEEVLAKTDPSMSKYSQAISKLKPLG
jgi:hypothetical protein|tara:strand:+ start:244 stop:1614 length:1371 start_codon:yes stop_codon:yes gene_type:complete